MTSCIFITAFHQWFGSLEILGRANSDLQITGAEMADVSDISCETALQVNGVRINFDIDEQVPGY